MSIRESLVLPIDVTITPVAQLAPAIRRRLGAHKGDAAITRLRGRSSARLVSERGAALLGEFRTPMEVSRAIINCARRWNSDPAELLRESFPLLKECYNSHFLVPANSPEAESTLPSRDRGDRIGRFRVLRCLQVIDETEVYQARDRDGSSVAIKLARPGHTGRARYRHEAAALEHLDGVVAPRLIAQGTHRERAWLAMSWCDGICPQESAAELRTIGDRRSLLAMLCGIANAYATLHRHGMLHGDVHLGNLLVDSLGTVRIIDFGLARPIPPLKLPGQVQVGGVLRYHAPEQAAALLEGHEMPAPTPFSEQYSLAVMLHLLATGRFPVVDSLDRRTLLTAIAQGASARFPADATPRWPALESVMAKALSCDPRERYDSVAAFAHALSAIPQPAARRSITAANHAHKQVFHAVVDTFLKRVGIESIAFGKPVRAPRASVMLGASGISYALYRIACIRDDPEILMLADAWQRQIEHAGADPLAFSSPRDGLGDDSLGPVSPFHAATGMHLVGALIALANDDSERTRIAIDNFCSTIQLPWHRRDLTLGRMGAVLGCTLLVEALPPEQDDLARILVKSGRSILDSIWNELDQLGRIGDSDAEENHGMAHGWAGLLWATLRWHDASGTQLPGSFRARLDELAAGAEPLGRGVHWAQRSTAIGPSILATHQVAGWCNGPAGLVQSMALAHRHYPSEGFDRLAIASAWSSWEAPAEIFDLCCGEAGRAYSMLTCHRLTGDPAWHRRAITLAERARVSFNAVRRELPRPFSLFKGEAGLALLAADLEHPKAAGFPFLDPEGFPARKLNGTNT